MNPRILPLLVAVVLIPGAVQAQLAVHGDTIYTMAGAPIVDGVVLVGKDGKIEQVGSAARVKIPKSYRTLTARVVTPGLVDAHSVVGLSGALNYSHDQDQLETSDPIQPELRAFDAYDARERLVEWLRGFGVTTLHTGHGPGALMSGQTMIVKTRGSNVGEALVDSATMVAMTLGPDVSDNFNGKSPGTRAKGVAMLRAIFIKAQDYARKRADADSTKRPARDLRLETVAKVLDGTLPALITAQGMSEILAALRLQREFGFKLVLDGAAESYMLLDEIKAAGVPVILHPTMMRNTGEAKSASLETARKLQDAGIPFALQSGFEGYVPKTRVVLFEAAIAAANGLTPSQALASITISAARILGEEKRIGSLETGKDGDLALFDGDPFQYTSHVCATVIEGQVVSEGLPVKRSAARLEILGAALLFSTGGAAIKAAQFTSWQVTGLRSGVAAVAVWLLIPASRQFRREGFGITLLTALAYAATLTLFVLANKLTTAANTIYLQSTAPLYILLLGPLLLKESITRRDFAFMLAVGLGMAFFFLGQQESFVTAPDPLKGNILALLSGVTYAGLLLGLRWMGTRGGSPAAAVAFGNLLAFLLAAPQMFPLGGHGATDWAVILYLGVFQIGLAYYLLTKGIPHVPAFEASLLLFLEPALNPLFAWLVHGERPGPWALVGGGLIMSATAVKAWADSREPASAASVETA